MNNQNVFKANTLYNNYQTGIGLYCAGQVAADVAHHADLRIALGRHVESATAIRNSRQHRVDRCGRQQPPVRPCRSAFRMTSISSVRASAYRLECWQHSASHGRPRRVGLLLRADAVDLFPHDRHVEADHHFLPCLNSAARPASGFPVSVSVHAADRRRAAFAPALQVARASATSIRTSRTRASRTSRAASSIRSRIT